MTAGHFETSSEEETRALGIRMATGLAAPTSILLLGPLGSGKTALTRGIAEGLGVDPRDVSSPTFTLVNLYAGRLPVAHVDLYRIGGDRGTVPEEELREAGILEVLGSPSVVLVEWGERLDRALVPPGWDVRMEHAGAERRRITVTSRP